MAFRKLYTDPFGCEHPNAYWKLDFFAFDLVAQQGRMEFSIYHDQSARENGKHPIPSGGGSRLGINFVKESEIAILSIENVISKMSEFGPRKALYLIAKQLPDFSNAADVLEDDIMA